ncbi:MAG: IMP cyclohydrolase [Oscillospiraceae bacterium]|nr:IMP cyclohydrolase [Oscillospiraceae bacterium]
MEAKTPRELLGARRYPGRGLLLGLDGRGRAAASYFIMGRSENSRNRVFARDGEGIKTEAADPAHLSDPSLIIYRPLAIYENKLIVTNGDQTETVLDYLKSGESFKAALETRDYEPDAPHYTPRISGLLELGAAPCCRLSILKAGPELKCERLFWEFELSRPGEGFLLHTYEDEGEPLPSFEGEPRRVRIEGGAEAFAKEVWESLDPENRISLYVKFIDLKGFSSEDFLINKYEKA